MQPADRALGAFVGMRDDWFAVAIGRKDLVRTETDANAAGFAPVHVNGQRFTAAGHLLGLRRPCSVPPGVSVIDF